MKPGPLACLKRAPLNFFILFLLHTLLVMAIVGFLITMSWLLLLIFPLYLFVATIVSTDLTKKCEDIFKAGMFETGYYYKDGTPVKRGYDYVAQLIMLLVIPATILGLILVL